MFSAIQHAIPHEIIEGILYRLFFFHHKRNGTRLLSPETELRVVSEVAEQIETKNFRKWGTHGLNASIA